MRADPLRGQVGGGLGPGNRQFLKWRRADRRLLFGAQKAQIQLSRAIPPPSREVA
jgi:hypothetical protein